MKQTIFIVCLICGALGALAYVLSLSKQQKSLTPVIDTIMARRSIRQYEAKAVEREKLDEIVKCGLNAPNALNLQEWEVRVVDSQKWIDECTADFVETVRDTPMGDHLLTPDFKNMYRNAPAVIFIAAKPGKFSGLNCGLMAENMMLAACELGLGTCCLGSPVPFLTGESGAKWLASLGFSEGYELVCAIVVGYAAEAPDAKPRDESKACYIEY